MLKLGPNNLDYSVIDTLRIYRLAPHRPNRRVPFQKSFYPSFSKGYGVSLGSQDPLSEDPDLRMRWGEA